MGISAEPPMLGAFQAEADITMTASLMRFELTFDNIATMRRPQDIARVGWEDWICIFHEKGELTQHTHRGRDIVTKTGDLIVADFTLPFNNKPQAAAGRNDLWFLPRALIAPHLSAGNGPLSAHFNDQTGIGRLIQSYLGGLGTTLDTLSEGEAASISDNLARLIAIGCGSLAATQGNAINAGQLTTIQQYITRNLADPALSPGTAAAAHRLSIRRIHVLFEPTGSSFSDHVLHQRLAACHAALVDPICAHRSVMDIAFGWGFNSLSAFYRGFARQYGIAPRDLRLGS